MNYKVNYLPLFCNNMETQNSHTLFRKAASYIAILGAIAALISVIYAGHNNKSIILVLLFAGWVTSPFAALLALNVSKRFVLNSPVVLYWLTMVIAIVSPVIYSGILSPPGTKLTPFFLLVPLVAWIIIAAFILITARPQK